MRSAIIFCSFLTTKRHLGDIDIFLLMENTFDASQLSGETALLFNHFTAWFISEKILLDNYDTIRDSGFGIRGSGFSRSV